MANEYLTTNNNIEVLSAPTSNVYVTNNVIEVLVAQPAPAGSVYTVISGNVSVTGGVTFT